MNARRGPRPEVTCPWHAVAERRPVPSRSAAWMPRPMPRRWGASPSGPASAHGPRCSCRAVPSPAPCPPTLGVPPRRRNGAVIPASAAEAGSKDRQRQARRHTRGRREAQARCALAGSQSVRAQAGAAGARSAWPKSAGGRSRRCRREGRRVLDGVEACITTGGLAHRRGVEEALPRSAARQLSGVEGAMGRARPRSAWGLGRQTLPGRAGRRFAASW